MLTLYDNIKDCIFIVFIAIRKTFFIITFFSIKIGSIYSQIKFFSNNQAYKNNKNKVVENPAFD